MTKKTDLSSGDAGEDRLVAELLDEAMDLDPGERRVFLESRCDDPALVRRVLRLLGNEEDAARTLDRPVMSGAEVDLEGWSKIPEDKEPPRRTVGPYTLEEVLGEGGMGRVYQAWQQHPVERRVALKIMRHGLSSAVDQARFEAERRSLARLSHPNIAQMFEAGATDDGCLYFAMELVPGAPITQYCDHHALPVWQRLQVFMEALLGVQHAHQNQLLHRDLKPSNILVTEIDGIPMVKVIDFGISLGLDELAGRVRQRGQRAGTPGYASPESLAPDAHDVHLDTRSDVYTLGIVLYELLCGQRPFDQPGDSPREVWRRISEETPLTPAQQLARLEADELARVAALRGARPRALARTLRGDIGAIVMKAIARDRDERYGSVGEFFADLERYLGHRPVSARAQDFTYVGGLFVRRNFGAVAAACLLLAAMGAGMVAWSTEARRAAAEADRANREAAQARRALAESSDLTDFLVNLFRRTGRESGQPERMTTRELLDLGAEAVRSEAGMGPLERARLFQLLAEIYTEIYVLDEAEHLVRESLALRREHLPEGHPDIAESLGQLGDIYRIEMRYEEAEPLLREALEIAEQSQPAHPSDVARAWNRIGTLYWNQERLDEAIAAHERALEIREIEMGGQDPAGLAESTYNLGIMLLGRDRYAEAVPYLEQAARLYDELLGENHLRTAAAFNNLAIAEENTGQLDDAEAHYRAAIRSWRGVYGEDHPRPMLAFETLVRALGRWGRAEEGVAAGREALETRIRVHGADHPDVVPAMIALGVNLGFAGDLEGARAQLEHAYSISESHFGADHRRTRAALDSLGWLAWQERDYATALSIHRSLLDRRLEDYGPDHALTAFSEHNTALALAALGRWEEAAALMESALTEREKERGKDHRATAQSLHYLGLIRWNQGRNEEARGLLA
ncbi:MAG: serine/threonine-protein kinase, partial [Gammaproteobacteria bacterium]